MLGCLSVLGESAVGLVSGDVGADGGVVTVDAVGVSPNKTPPSMPQR